MAKRETKPGTKAWAAPDHDRVLLAIDPGEVHVGLAVFHDGTCIDAFEMAPHETIVLVRDLLSRRRLHTLVVEQFRLYPWLAEQQAFSDFKTVELIGVLRYLWATRGELDTGELTNKQGERLATAIEWCTWVENPATIKTPTRAILKARKIKSTAARLRAGGHASDAELHGYHYLLAQEGKIDVQYRRGRGGMVAQVETQGSPDQEKVTSGTAGRARKAPTKKAVRKVGAAGAAKKVAAARKKAAARKTPAKAPAKKSGATKRTT